MQVRLYEEQLVRQQIMEPIEEGLFSGIRNRINERANNFVRQALSEEIEMGKKLNQEIQEAVDKLKEKIEEIQKYVEKHGNKKGKIFDEVQKIFNDIHKTSFELLEILSGVKINFADYVQNAAMATMVNFGMLTIPMRSTFLLKKSYKYFIGIIKNTIRKDMLMLMLNFDQFENTVLIQSLEDDEQNKVDSEVQTRLNAYDEFARRLIGGEGGKKRSLSKAEIDKITKVTRSLKDGIAMQMKLNDRKSGAIGFDTRYDNTYTKTLDQLKNFVLEDDTKYLESIKNGMRSLTLEEIDTKVYVELLISAAEECAYEVSNAIHTNFIEKVSVFKLANQKTLIDLIKKEKEIMDKEAEEKEKKRREKMDERDNKKKMEAIKALGEEIFKKVTSSEIGKDQVSEFEKLGKKKYKGKEYDERYILESWLDISDGGYFKNWKENEDKISDLLKLHLDIVCNDKSYKSYSDILVDCLLPCAMKEWEDFDVRDIFDLSRIEKVERVSESKKYVMEHMSHDEDSEKPIEKLSKKPTVESKDDDIKEVLEKIAEILEELKKEHKEMGEFMKRGREDSSIKLKNAFCVLKLKEKISIFTLFDSICGETEGEEKETEYKGCVVDWLKYESDKEKIGIWREALRLISKNLVKLENDIIIEILENLFNNMLRIKPVSEITLKKIVEKLEKLEKMKDNDYGEEPGSGGEGDSTGKSKYEK